MKSQPTDLQVDNQMSLAFEDLKKEILLGHQDILEGKVTSLADVGRSFRIV